MSGTINVSISGEIIESQNYLSNYFVTLTSDQTITGNKTFNSNGFNFINGQINASTLDISSGVLSFNGNTGIYGDILTSNGNYPIWQPQLNTTFGSSLIDSTLNNGTIFFGKEFNNPPFVTITQLSNRIVPIAVTSINTSSFSWAAVSTNVGTIMWSAGY
jgi:hypothetical protein